MSIRDLVKVTRVDFIILYNFEIFCAKSFYLFKTIWAKFALKLTSIKINFNGKQTSFLVEWRRKPVGHIISTFVVANWILFWVISKDIGCFKIEINGFAKEFCQCYWIEKWKKLLSRNWNLVARWKLATKGPRFYQNHSSL